MSVIIYRAQSAYIHTHTHTHTHTHIYIFIYKNRYIHTNIYTNICKHIYIHTYIYTYIHTYIHTYMDAKMAEDGVTRDIEAALNKIVNTTEQSGNMRKELKKTIYDNEVMEQAINHI